MDGLKFDINFKTERDAWFTSMARTKIKAVTAIELKWPLSEVEERDGVRSTQNHSRMCSVRHIGKNEIRYREYRGAKNIPDASLDESSDRPCISRDLYSNSTRQKEMDR